MNKDQLVELLYQGLETERGGIQVYTTAIDCAVNDDLREEWQKYLEQTTHHEQVMTDVLTKLGCEVELETPGRAVVRHIGESLVAAMEMARTSGTPEAAELVAGECVVSAETKDHLNWELIRIAAEAADKKTAQILNEAADEVEDEEDEHLYHTQGWCRELWLESLGLEAQLPPPEEVEDVSTAAEAQQARQERLARH